MSGHEIRCLVLAQVLALSCDQKPSKKRTQGRTVGCMLVVGSLAAFWGPKNRTNPSPKNHARI